MKLPWGRKKVTSESVFVKHYNNVLCIFNAIPEIQGTVADELLPAMFVVCDYAALSANKDRKSIAEPILTKIPSLNRTLTQRQFDNRMNLYGEIIRGKPLRREWIMEQKAAWEDHPIMKITILLGDILYNPSCADDYEGAPIMLHDFIECSTFSTCMLSVLDEMASLFKEIYNL